MISFVTEVGQCRALWDRFSPRARPWDEWELMYAFHDESRYRFNFMVHETNGAVDGLIPLVEDGKDGSFELFGGCYADGRVLWIAPADFQACFDALPDNTAFFDLDGAWVNTVLELFPALEPNFAEHESQYYLVPADFNYDFTHHIQTFSSKKRQNFLRDLRKIRERKLELSWSDADESELFVTLSRRNFGDESDYAAESGKREVHRVVGELQGLGLLRTLTISVDGVKQAVSLSALYKNYWVALYSASNNEYDNLGKLLNVETIQEGCRLKVDEVNFMTGTTWKAAWQMKTNPCRTMRKPAKPPPGEAEPAG